MAEQGFELDVLRDLLEEAAAVGQLSKTEKPFVTPQKPVPDVDAPLCSGTTSALNWIGVFISYRSAFRWIVTW